jgi:hypothetical protein
MQTLFRNQSMHGSAHPVMVALIVSAQAPVEPSRIRQRII